MPAEWVIRLLPDEKIVWEGTPRPGFHFRLIDIPLMLFGFVFTAISSVFVVKAFPFGLLLPHFWVGLYMLGGRFFVDRKVRADTRYAITNSRALIVRRWPTQRVRTVNLNTVSEIDHAVHADGTGTICFGGSYSPFATSSFGRRQTPPAFEFIEDADLVMRLVHQPHGRNDPPPTPHHHPRPPT
jgi:hypothetical protein